MDASIVSYGFMQNALISGIMIGLILPFIGIIILSRRMVFLADSLGHINMSGISFAVFLGSFSSLFSNIQFVIAIIWTILGAILIEYLRDHYSEYKEVSITIVYALAIALTMIFLDLSSGYSADVFNVLFGNINAISRIETLMIVIITLVLLFILKLIYPKLLILAMEEEYIKLYGLNSKKYRYITMIIVTLVISIAIKVVGVLLVSSLLTIPLLSATRIAKNLKKTIIYAIMFTEIAIISGIFVAYYINLSTSAIIVIMLLVIYAITMIKGE